MFAVLEFWDFLAIFVIVSIFAGGAGAYAKTGPSYGARLRRLEGKLDLVLKHLNLEYQVPGAGVLSDEVRRLADDPTKKIQAIALHREETGAGLREAKDAIEAYINGRFGIKR